MTALATRRSRQTFLHEAPWREAWARRGQATGDFQGHYPSQARMDRLPGLGTGHQLSTWPRDRTLATHRDQQLHWKKLVAASRRQKRHHTADLDPYDPFPNCCTGWALQELPLDLPGARSDWRELCATTKGAPPRFPQQISSTHYTPPTAWVQAVPRAAWPALNHLGYAPTTATHAGSPRLDDRSTGLDRRDSFHSAGTSSTDTMGLLGQVSMGQRHASAPIRCRPRAITKGASCSLKLRHLSDRARLASHCVHGIPGLAWDSARICGSTATRFTTGDM